LSFRDDYNLDTDELVYRDLRGREI